MPANENATLVLDGDGLAELEVGVTFPDLGALLAPKDLRQPGSIVSRFFVRLVISLRKGLFLDIEPLD
jgi:hypothetical protein